MKDHIIHSEILSTKANTLHALRSMLTLSRIEEMYILKIGDFFADREKVCREIMEQFRGCRIVVRSSSSNEDNMRRSNAGHYRSVLDVDSADLAQIIDSVEAVIHSYRKDIDVLELEQVLIQRQAESVKCSGVVFTRDLQGNRPYYLINYDDGGATDSVTGGRGGKTLWVSRSAEVEQLPSPWSQLLLAVQEAEHILEGLALDIEFAVDADGEVILFQIRPLVAGYKTERVMEDSEYFARKAALKRYYHSVPGLLNKTMLLSDMAFWNPSEIIGANPRSLDYSLYRHIITSGAWNAGLLPLGYRKVDGDLMYRLGNKPYISLDKSFFSLQPASIPDTLAQKLCHFYAQKLGNNLTAHDKIEFEIVYTSYDFTIEERSRELLAAGFTEEERNLLLTELKKLTDHAIAAQSDILEGDRALLGRLNTLREATEAAVEQEIDLHQLIATIEMLLDAIAELGVTPFARQARMAFMARAFCLTLVEAGDFTEDEMDRFMTSVNTVSSKFEADFNAYSAGKLDRATFDRKYGHLRTGTYDIRTDRYDKLTFRPISGKKQTFSGRREKYRLDEKRLSAALSRAGFDCSPLAFMDFMTCAIEQREYFKFEFTRSLSLVLELIQKLGEMLQITRNDLSWLEVADFSDVPEGCTASGLKVFWEDRLTRRSKDYEKDRELILPEVVLSDESLDMIPVYEARPNFITSKAAEGEVVLLEEERYADLTDKIVVVPTADPGYEWIFAKSIKGFITKYGGAASHMAIRCAEFEIPAAIGCGEKIYSEVSKMSYLRIDCKAEKIDEGIQYHNLSALITQRESVNAYGYPTDVQEAAYMRFCELLGFIPKPVSNYTKNVEKLFDKKRDLLIVAGGGALAPSWYDHPHTESVQPNRDRTEEKLIRYCVMHQIPVIAICRGMQYMNVLFGGKLRYHPTLRVARPRQLDHPVKLVKENRTIHINNFHEDVIYTDDLAPCFEPLAVDVENDVVEAFYSDDMKILALQWHPERPFLTANAAEETRKLIIDFMQKYIR
ncbi:MAG: gamma-glutamyl-gamma-aminobutyrate hydrolase family protein [Clostridia bacterium]|nr:gamma-glutamyl-gamma-aminobutyrate hydrolase family protein [Clostridia bacterium]